MAEMLKTFNGQEYLVVYRVENTTVSYRFDSNIGKFRLRIQSSYSTVQTINYSLKHPWGEIKGVGENDRWISIILSEENWKTALKDAMFVAAQVLYSLW